MDSAASLRSAIAASSLTEKQLASTKASAKEFEGLFISEMMSHMFEGVGNDPMFGGGQAEEMFHGLMVQEYGKQMAGRGGIGIADQLQRMMIEMQQNVKG